MRTLCTLTLLCLVTAAACGAEFGPVLNGQIDGQPAAEMMLRYSDGLAQECYAARTTAYEAVETQEDAEAYAARLRKCFEEQLGGFPERTPLNARTVDQGEGDGYRYEKVIFESQPDFLVSAVLYLPMSSERCPGVLVPCGHSNNGKASEVYQRACISLARNGIAALIYDPFGQGERYYYLKDDGKPEFGTTLQHTVAGVGAILTGTNMATYRIYDGMRGLDYLAARPEVDETRLGCTGNSGGGTLTSYIMALDERVACAAPSCYLTTFERLLATIGPQDAEQDIFGQLAAGIDQPDYVLMRAPKPTLLCTATQDFFDITGSWDNFRQAKRFYARYGLSERVDIIEYDDEHGFSQPRREAMVRWMRRWLQGKDDPVTEDTFQVLTDEEAQCSAKGQLILQESAVSVPQLNMRREGELAKQRAAFWRDTPKEQVLAKVAECIGAQYQADAAIPSEDMIESIPAEGYTVKKVVLHAEDGIVLPAILLDPEKKSGNAILVCPPDGKEEALAPGSPLLGAAAAGDVVLVVDLRGLGETAPVPKYKEWTKYVGVDWQDYFRAYLVGQSYVGMRTEDIFAAARYLKTIAPGEVSLFARGRTTVPALHAAALAPDFFLPRPSRRRYSLLVRRGARTPRGRPTGQRGSRRLGLVRPAGPGGLAG